MYQNSFNFYYGFINGPHIRVYKINNSLENLWTQRKCFSVHMRMNYSPWFEYNWILWYVLQPGITICCICYLISSYCISFKTQNDTNSGRIHFDELLCEILCHPILIRFFLVVPYMFSITFVLYSNELLILLLLFIATLSFYREKVGIFKLLFDSVLQRKSSKVIRLING